GDEVIGARGQVGGVPGVGTHRACYVLLDQGRVRASRRGVIIEVKRRCRWRPAHRHGWTSARRRAAQSHPVELGCDAWLEGCFDRDTLDRSIRPRQMTCSYISLCRQIKGVGPPTLIKCLEA